MGDWRRPLDVKIDVDYSMTQPGEESVLNGVMSRETAARLARGEGCYWCFSSLPGWPRRENLKLYTSADWNLPHRGPGAMLDLILRGCCVVCGGEISPEGFARMVEFGEAGD